jgi:hypothetical protein
MSLALVGAGTSLAQSTTGIAGHSAYVTMVGVEGTAGAEEVAGTVACDAPLHQRVVRSTLGRPVCTTDEYAYAYPNDAPAPWTSDIIEVDQSTYVDEEGSAWHVAEVSYRTIGQAPEGGPELVKAMASEIVPEDGDSEELSYAMPVDEDLIDGEEADLVVDVGPSPQDAPEQVTGASLPAD